MTDSSVSTTSNNGFANPARAVAPTQRRPALVVIVLANFLFFFGYRLWQSLFSNFAVQGLGVRADQMGLIQSIREIPGLLAGLSHKKSTRYG